MGIQEKIAIMLEAITFAEAGDFVTAKELMKQMQKKDKAAAIGADESVIMFRHGYGASVRGKDVSN